jgi:hypothetical protein
MNFKYYPDNDGGFIATEDGQTQICDFRQGMGAKYGEALAYALNTQLLHCESPLSLQQIKRLEHTCLGIMLCNVDIISETALHSPQIMSALQEFSQTLIFLLSNTKTPPHP